MTTSNSSSFKTKKLSIRRKTSFSPYKSERTQLLEERLTKIPHFINEACKCINDKAIYNAVGKIKAYFNNFSLPKDFYSLEIPNKVIVLKHLIVDLRNETRKDFKVSLVRDGIEYHSTKRTITEKEKIFIWALLENHRIADASIFISAITMRASARSEHQRKLFIADIERMLKDDENE